MRTTLLLALLSAFLALPALAADPECAATAHNPANTYDATSAIKFCTPETDDAGDPLDPTEISSCSVFVDGVSTITVNTTRVGGFISIPTAGSAISNKRGSLTISCAGPVGTGGSTAATAAIFRRGRPGTPKVLD
jgi:hypothetical protein